MMSTDKIKEFQEEVRRNIEEISKDEELKEYALKWIVESFYKKYSYNFSWMGRPIIQYPQDIVAMQELVWSVKPDLIIETGIAHGGSLIFYSSMMQLVYGTDYTKGHVLGIDIDIREHNRREIEAHPMFDRITMFEGSSIDDSIMAKIDEFVIKGQYKKILVVLDSMHTTEHVLEELRKYSKYVTKGSYIVAMDTYTEKVFGEIEKQGKGAEHLNRDFGANSGPLSAVKIFLDENCRFEIADDVWEKLSITCAPQGYLRCISD